jgi:hypothetical protein
VLVKRDAVGTRHESKPAGHAEEAVVHGQHRPVTLADASHLPDDLVRLHVEAADGCLAESVAVGLVDEAKHLHDGGVLWLADELGERPDVVEHSLSVGQAHDT